MIKDLRSKISGIPAVALTTATGTVTGAGSAVDTLGYDSVTFIVTPHSAHSTSTLSFEVQDSTASGSGFTAVSDTYLVGVESGMAISSGATGTLKTIGYIGGKRYARLHYTPNATATGVVFSANAILGDANKIPTVSATA
jgi:hypothetical protein